MLQTPFHVAGAEWRPGYLADPIHRPIAIAAEFPAGGPRVIFGSQLGRNERGRAVGGIAKVLLPARAPVRLSRLEAGICDKDFTAALPGTPGQPFATQLQRPQLRMVRTLLEIYPRRVTAVAPR